MGGKVVEAVGADRIVAALASRQHGVVARRQLLDASLTAREIDRRLAAGSFEVAHRGVYLVGHRAVTSHGRWLAAVLACGDGAVLSHRFAAALWGLARAPTARVEVTAGPGARGARRGIAVHRSCTLTEHDRTTRHGLPVTTVARTFLDLASILPPTQLREAFEAADRLELLDLDALAALCRRSSGRRGTGRLREILAHHTEGAVETRSALEHRFAGFCRRAGLPTPAINVPIAGLEVDCAWPDQRLVVELDGYAFHRGRAAFERDRRRDARLTMAGYTVIRLTDRRLRNEPSTVAAEIRSLLGTERY